MVGLRPHTLRVVSKTEGHDLDNGDGVEGKEIVGDPIECRHEPNGKAKTIALPDGEAYTYSYVIYLDVSDINYPYGTTIQLFDESGSKVIEKQSKGFHRGQLNMRIWL